MFGIFKFIKLSFFILLLALIGTALTVPSRKDLFKEYDATLDSLSNYDYRTAAEQYWKENQQEYALACLEYVITNNMPDKAACEILYKDYLKQIEKRNSWYERCVAFGKGFLVGEVTSYDDLAGSVTGDLVMYGDVRDLVKQFVFEDKKDSVIIAMSTLGIFTTLYPPVDTAPALIKTAKKAGVITEGVGQHIVGLAKVVKEDTKGGAKISEKVFGYVKSTMTPFVELAENSKTWTQFSSFLKNSKDITTIRAINKLINKDAAVARKLEQILILSGRNSEAALQFSLKYSRAGMDVLYSALSKGPRALRFVANHPRLTFGAIKNVDKISVELLRNYYDYLTAQSVKFGKIFEYARYGVIAFASFLLSLMILPVGLLKRLSPDSARASAFKNFRNFASFYIFIGLMASASAFIYKFFYHEPTPMDNSLPNFVKDSEILSATSWTDTTWTVEIKMREDYMINEDYMEEFFAPLVQIGNKKYVICDFSKLGFTWSEIKHFRLYELSLTVSKRGGNARSIKVESILVLKNFDNLVLIEIPDSERTKSLSYSQDLDFFVDDVLHFRANRGISASKMDLTLQHDKIYVRSEVELGDGLATKNGVFLGEITGKVGPEFYALRIPQDKADWGAIITIPLVKSDTETYYKNFAKAVKELWK